MMSEKKKENIAIINGPNINILGIREPDVYGRSSWDEMEGKLNKLGEKLGVCLFFYQSNYEGGIVDYIQEHLDILDGVVIKPAAFTKTGYSILAGVIACGAPFVEVHLSNIFERGGWHAETIFAPYAVGHINGFQGNVYTLGLQALCDHIREKKK